MFVWPGCTNEGLTYGVGIIAHSAIQGFDNDIVKEFLTLGFSACEAFPLAGQCGCRVAGDVAGPSPSQRGLA